MFQACFSYIMRNQAQWKVLNKSTLSLHHLHYLEPTMSPASITAYHSLSPLYPLVIQTHIPYRLLHIPCCFIHHLKLLPKGFPKESRKCNLSHPSISLAVGVCFSKHFSFYFVLFSCLVSLNRQRISLPPKLSQSIQNLHRTVICICIYEYHGNGTF